MKRSDQMSRNVIGKIAILLIVSLSMASIQGAGTHGKDPTGTSDPSNIDSDGDGLPNSKDADPNDVVIDWPPAPEASYAVIEMEQFDFADYTFQPLYDPLYYWHPTRASIGKGGAVLWEYLVKSNKPYTDWEWRYRVWKNGAWINDITSESTKVTNFRLTKIYECQKDSSSPLTSIPVTATVDCKVSAPQAICGDFILGVGEYNTEVSPPAYSNGNSFIGAGNVATLWTLGAGSITANPIDPPNMMELMPFYYFGGSAPLMGVMNYRAVASPGGACAILGTQVTAGVGLWKIWNSPDNGGPAVPGQGNPTVIAAGAVPYDDMLRIRAIEDGGVAVGERYGASIGDIRHQVANDHGSESELPGSDGRGSALAICRVPTGVSGQSRLVAAGTDLWVQKDGQWKTANYKPSSNTIIAVAKNGVLLGTHAIWRNGKEISLDSLVANQKVSGPDSAARYTKLLGYAMNGEGIIVALADDARHPGSSKKTLLNLLPVEVAPEVLAVNSDFDEGRIDPATGYAIPDCDDIPGVDQKTGSGNTQIALNASRAHLDGLFANDEKVTDDMHKGWFGVNPNQLGDDFWAGANVTIRKIDKDDPDTGYKESGQVRFYAKWEGGFCGIAPYDFRTLQPVNLVSEGVNLRPNEGVYGASSTIPDGAEFYMEGVRPGKITLEWRLQKGTIDVKHEQTFKVVTQKTLGAWRDELRYQIRLQSSVAGEEIDLNNFEPTNEFTSNTKFLKATYGWYQQNFVQSEDKLIWAGMAKMAGAPVYAALSDAQVARAVGPGIGVELTARQLQRALMKGNKDIFLDLAWQHRAYAASGIYALRFVDENDESVGLRSVQMTDWITIDHGFWQDSLFKSSLGARELLRREQRFIIEAVYLEIVALELDEIISILAKNPIPNFPPLGKSFAEIVQVGNLAVFDDRWRWIKSDMYPGWTGITEFSLDLGVELGSGSGGYSKSDRLTYSKIALSSRAKNYATFPNSVP